MRFWLKLEELEESGLEVPCADESWCSPHINARNVIKQK